MRIGLEIQRVVDPHPPTVPRRFLARLYGRIRFRQGQGWSDDHTALIDTGAPYSVVPLALWPALRMQRVATQAIRGIVPGVHAEMSAELAKISAQLLDATHRSPRLTLWAMLAESDRVPLILGWSGCLDRVRLVVDAPHRRAWLAF